MLILFIMKNIRVIDFKCNILFMLNMFNLKRELCMRIIKKLMLLFFINTVFCAYSQNAALDPTFGNAGIAVHPHPNTAEIKCFAFDNNGNIISAGYVRQGGAGTSNYQLTLTKTDRNGMLDNTFGTNGKVTTVIGHSESPEDIVIQPDGKIIVVGSAYLGSTPSGPGPYNAFAVRYNANGSLDTSFATNGIYKLTSARQFVSVMLLSTGSIVLGGNTSLNNEYLAILVKLDTNGVEDSLYGTNGVLSLNSSNFKFLMWEAILLNNGSIFCVGYEYSDILNHSKSAYCKIDSFGNFDTTFGTNGKVTLDLFNYNSITNITELLHTARELPNGQIVVGGTELNPFLLKMNSNGSLDSTFGTNGMKILSYSFRPRAMALQANGKIIIGGLKMFAIGNNGYTVTRLDNDGNLDITFNNGKGLVDINASAGDDWLNHIKLQSNDTLIIGGGSKINNAYNFTLARLLLDTPLSVEEPLEQFIKVYPNPFNDRLFVDDFEGIIKNIKIFDNTGRIIKTVSNSNPIKEIYTDFANGIYNITVETKDGRIMNKKMIKK